MIKDYFIGILILLLFLSILFLSYRSKGLQRRYKAEALEGLERTKGIADSILTEKDIANLPKPVQNYLKYVGVVGNEKVKNFKATIDGSMKTDKEKDWSEVQVKQYSFVDDVTRLFYLELNMSGIPVVGLHSYKDANATMLIKVAGLIPVVDGKGKEMNQAETVTVLNDMCILAPATLIDERIKWEPIDSLTTKATFNNEGIEVTAT